MKPKHLRFWISDIHRVRNHLAVLKLDISRLGINPLFKEKINELIDTSLRILNKKGKVDNGKRKGL